MDPDDPLSIVIHDMRSPLNAIGLACEALESDLPAEDRARYVAAIRRAAVRAERVLRDIIDLTEIERGELRLERRPVSVRGLIDQARAAHQVQLDEAAVELIVELPVEPGQVFADGVRIGQVLGQLLGNALRHAKGSPIHLEVQVSDDDVELAVRDHGPGIAAERLPELFERRQRRDRRHRVGLGLPLARGMVVAHGGTLTVTSEVGQGARFAIRLPRRAPGDAAR